MKHTKAALLFVVTISQVKSVEIEPTLIQFPHLENGTPPIAKNDYFIPLRFRTKSRTTKKAPTSKTCECACQESGNFSGGNLTVQSVKNIPLPVHLTATSNYNWSWVTDQSLPFDGENDRRQENTLMSLNSAKDLPASNVTCNCTYTCEKKNEKRRKGRNEETILAVTVIFLATVGFIGNSASFAYFLKKWKKSPELFYMLISGINIVLSVAATPVVVSLFNQRRQSWFQIQEICVFWNVSFFVLLRVSVLVIMFLNIFRTIAVVKPFFHMHQYDKKVYVVVLFYLILLVIIDVVYISSPYGEIEYLERFAFCEMQPGKETGNGTLNSFSITISVLYGQEIFLPSAVVSICFIVTTGSLFNCNSEKLKVTINDLQKRKNVRAITITASIFTGLFLCCNLPRFIEQTIYLAAGFNQERLMSWTSQHLFEWQKYSHFIGDFLLALVYSTISSCVYFARMSALRTWITTCKGKGISFSSLSRTRFSNMTMRVKTARQGAVNSVRVQALPRSLTNRQLV